MPSAISQAERSTRGAADGAALGIVIPAYNEEGLLRSSVEGLLEAVERRVHGGEAPWRALEAPGALEVLIVENGSTDATLAVARELASEHAAVRVLSLPFASYGRALRTGLDGSRGAVVCVFNVDFWDLDFLGEAMRLLGTYDGVVGSKVLGGGDTRPPVRRALTRSFNLALTLLFGFRGTDTHGIKALRRTAIEKVLPRCRTEGEILDTELVLRCQRAGLRLTELPITVREVRPSRYGLVDRVPSTARDLVRLFVALH